MKLIALMQIVVIQHGRLENFLVIIGYFSKYTRLDVKPA